MLYNKYQYVDDPILLTKPRRAIIPSGANLSRFDSKSPTLTQDCNFALEMLKFLPKTEVMGYAGQELATPYSSGAVDLSHPWAPQDNDLWVTQDYYDAFNEYSVDPGTMIDINSTGDPTKYVAAQDENGDGKVTNSDIIKQYDDLNPGGDGLSTWFSVLVAGKHHRTGTFGPFGNDGNDGIAGDGMLTGFSNIDGLASSCADNWNHIGGVGGFDTQAYNPTVNAALQANGLSWGDVEAMLRNNFPGKNYYEIVMDGNYKNLSAKDSFLLTCAMDESRYRAFKAMTDMFGSASDTRSDASMIASVNKYLGGLNTFSEHHSVSLIPFFMYIQHSFINQLTNFYGKGLKEDNPDHGGGPGEGWSQSYLDEKNFSYFSYWMGRSSYDDNQERDLNDRSYKATDDSLHQSLHGQLYAQRGQLTGGSDDARVKATSDLIEEWFGATDPATANANINGPDKLAEPVYEGYGDDQDWDNSNWQRIDLPNGGFSNLRVWTDESKRQQCDGVTITAIYVPNIAAASYGWDRKYNGNDIYCEDAQGKKYWAEIQDEAEADNAWIKLHNAYSTSLMSPAITIHHANYAASQFEGLTADDATSGALFNDNWVVHAIGMYYRQGTGLDLFQVVNKAMTRRQADVDYKTEVTDYTDRQQELMDEQYQDALIAAKAQARAAAERKKWLAKNSKKSGSPKTHAASAPKAAPSSNSNSAAQKQAFGKALQSMSSKLYDGAAKRKALLKKNQDNNS